MQLSIGTLSLDIGRGFIFAEVAGHEFFIKRDRPTGVPLRPFMVTTAESREVWGFGFYAALS